MNPLIILFLNGVFLFIALIVLLIVVPKKREEYSNVQDDLATIKEQIEKD